MKLVGLVLVSILGGCSSSDPSYSHQDYCQMKSLDGYDLQSVSPNNAKEMIESGIEHNKIEFERWINPVTNTVAWFSKGQNELYACLYNSDLVPAESFKFAIRFKLDLNGNYIPVKPLREIIVVTGGRS